MSKLKGIDDGIQYPVQAVKWACHAETSIRDASGLVIAETSGNGEHSSLNEAHAARIAACLNAMQSIDDPAAARALLDDPRVEAMTDMLEALKAIQEVANYPANISESELWSLVGKCGEIAEAAIAKAEGRS